MEPNCKGALIADTIFLWKIRKWLTVIHWLKSDGRPVGMVIF